jgi:chlorobactene glucosyltransferase
VSLAGWLTDPEHILGFVGAQAIIAASNALLLRRLDRFPPPAASPMVSLLVPARDEQESIGPCVESLLAQDYGNFEVVILDDGSQDRTAAVLAGLRAERLRVLEGKPLPEGWNGKAWACQQLAESAQGELLLFTDADTVFQPQTVRLAVGAMAATRADLLTAITGNEVCTLGEQLTVPFVSWSILSFLPLVVTRLFPRSVAFTAANGKFMLFRRQAYQAVGGHAAVRDHATEDIAIARSVRRHGYRWRIMDATPLVKARMYSGLTDAVAGFSKNLFALYDYRVLVALFVWAWLLVITWYPVALVAAALRAGQVVPPAPLATIVISSGVWLLTSFRFGLPWHLFLLGPAIVAVSAYTGFRALILVLIGRACWKGRRLVARKPRLI